MAVSYMDFTSPSTQFTYDPSKNRIFTKDKANFINELSVNQLNTLGNASFLDIFLSKGNVVEPHIHQNATETVYVISGAAIVSLINPFTKELRNFPVTPFQVANIPQGWFHYEVATEDHTHLLSIFDAPIPEFIAVSDFLRLVPANLLAHTYCLDEAKVKETLSPIKTTVTLGPPANCKQPRQDGADHAQARISQSQGQPIPNRGQNPYHPAQQQIQQQPQQFQGQNPYGIPSYEQARIIQAQALYAQQQHNQNAQYPRQPEQLPTIGNAGSQVKGQPYSR
ncbi:oxalate decarboxylase/phosphoglucose isomerase-like protein (cupin superfamily) [Paenibacillus shirakamiensis]|uniref:Oxalate decarboxylase/phosphoglucose isomerase-like protein (Cupin superfamily) n=1 Tax=Paenibacillus shirakamiensis TaxID=1265935 RepID=A0ABS4JDS0_9BACL|nr:cupin domain-containing protein [Paenibacillus shirakamiensis]MBP1999849.1 oxalate decarboxylase/phosphoglucose isomerase-like protein (cupin superfamily) [Paenibacillus shirakamiensis]